MRSAIVEKDFERLADLLKPEYRKREDAKKKEKSPTQEAAEIATPGET